MTNNQDPYAEVRKFLPPEAKIAFTFSTPEDGCSIVYYVDSDYGAVKDAYFNGNTKELLAYEDSAHQAMQDDGLGKFDEHVNPSKQNDTRQGRDALLERQFTAANRTKKLCYQLLSNFQAPSTLRVAVGVDVTLFRGFQGNTTKWFVKSEWDLADEVLNLLTQHPLTSDSSGTTKILEDNIDQVFHSVLQMMPSAPKTENGNRIITLMWDTFNRNLDAVQYHPKLAPLYEQTLNSLKTHMMSQL